MMPGETFTPRFGTSLNFSQYVRFNPNSFGEVFADFVFVNFEGGDEVDVADMIAAIIDMHQTRHSGVFFSILIILGSLNQGTSAVTNADKSYTNFRHQT